MENVFKLYNKTQQDRAVMYKIGHFTFLILRNLLQS